MQKQGWGSRVMNAWIEGGVTMGVSSDGWGSGTLILGDGSG